MILDDIKTIHEKNKLTFEKNFNLDGSGRSTACSIWDAMTENKENCDNCLGENFNQLLETLQFDFFEGYKPTENTRTEFYFTTYILWLYLFVERVDFVFDVITKGNKNELFTDHKIKNFQTLRLIKKWANFIKHPKEFIFCHWPIYTFDGQLDHSKNTESIFITSKYVEDHYSDPKTRVVELENKTDVIVLVPDLCVLTSKFCDELNQFFKFICENKIVSDYLKNKSTIEYYYNETSVPIENEVNKPKV
jgi:hypothetical protein